MFTFFGATCSPTLLFSPTSTLHHHRVSSHNIFIAYVTLQALLALSSSSFIAATQSHGKKETFLFVCFRLHGRYFTEIPMLMAK